MLQVDNVYSGYGQKRVLNGVSIQVNEGEIVALIGANGAGKSTLLKTVFGLLRVWNGAIYLYGQPIHNRPPVANVLDGVSYVMQGSRVFNELTVDENLDLAGFLLSSRKTVAQRKQQMCELFPVLADRRFVAASRLSGGEKQMLALAQALMTQPRMLLLDEPSLGLSPQATRTALGAVQKLNAQLGTTVLVAEQNVVEVLAIAHRVYVLRQGVSVLESRPSDLTRETLRTAFLGTG